MQVDLTNKRMQALATRLRHNLDIRGEHRALLDELAKGLGFKSYAAMKAAMDAATPPAADTAPTGSEDWEAFQARLHASPGWTEFTNKLRQMARPGESTAQAARIGYAVLPDGYAVQGYDSDNRPIDSLSIRGDNKWLDPAASSVKSPEWLFVRARQDALEMARNAGVPEARVFEDTDLERQAQSAAGPDASWSDPRTVEITFAPRVRGLGVTVIIDAHDHHDFRAQLQAHENALVDRLNDAFARAGDLRLSGAADYGVNVTLESPGEIVDVYEP